jgi:uncharacterized protein (TIGR02246 family)
MKKLLFSLLIGVIALAALGVSAQEKPEQAGNKAAEDAVRAVLARYQEALNASDTTAVMKLYADDGVFMPEHSQSAVGAEDVRKAYDAVFQTIKLQVKFKVAEVVVTSPDWAFARTNSAGTCTVLATGAKSAEGNQELFIFKKSTDGTWKIARYCFCTTNPPSGEKKETPDGKKETGRKELSIVGVLKVKEGTETEMRDIFAALVPLSRKDKGNLRYELYQDRNDSRRFVYVQRWVDEESQRQHDKESAHIKEFTKNHLQKVESAEIFQLTLIK